MNSQENSLAAHILQEIQASIKTQPEKAKNLSEAYKTLCAAYEIRMRAERVQGQ